MIRGLLMPPDAYAEECLGDVLWDPVLPDEVEAVRMAAASRRLEFHTVRALARRAMRQLAAEAPSRYEDHALLPDARGAPAWPPGVVGSMTHIEGYRAAVVAKSSIYAAIGLDAERKRELPAEVCEIVCRPEELSMLDALARQEPSLPWSCVLFSAKESVYKAWYPLTGAWLDFDDVSVQIEHDSPTFRARVPAHSDADGTSTVEELEGRWMSLGDFILTTAYLRTASP